MIYLNATRAIALSGKTGSTCTVNVKGVETIVEVARSITTITIGDALLVVPYGDGTQLMATSVFGLAPPAPQPDPPEPSPAPPTTPSKPTNDKPRTGKTTITPIETRSRQDSKWRTDNDDVYQGEYGNGNHVGCWFYGTKAKSLSGATCTGITMKLKRKSKGGSYSGQTLTLRLVDQNKRPSGAPSLGSSISGPSLKIGESRTFTLPDSWGQALIDGTSGGIAVYESDGSPYVVLLGRGSYSASGTLSISWKRTS